MQIIVLATAAQKQELIGNTLASEAVTWISEVEDFPAHKDADAFIDLEFVNDEQRKAVLVQLLPKPVVINSVVDTLKETGPGFIRINGWPTFLSSSLVEAACSDAGSRQSVENVFAVFEKEIVWLPDEPGFVAARVVSMIVNEAFLALGEGVSTKEEINTAMKLGTAYPFGPFEWAEKLGVQNVVTLLKKLGQTMPRYQPSELMVQETNKGL
ncbi:MAG TPA: 3-hydroxyacyl-CoA dehydrogenase family protein [Flavisolibacter sp.]|nr:3-hydroxyacyl-CoA dehydrogenase family protein [Flavisolibacter sp.]